MRSGIAASSSASAQNLSFKGPGSPTSKSVFSLRKSVNTAFDMAQKHVTRSMNYLQDESRHTNETCVYLNRSHTIARNCHSRSILSIHHSIGMWLTWDISTTVIGQLRTRNFQQQKGFANSRIISIFLHVSVANVWVSQRLQPQATDKHYVCIYNNQSF